jgi:hypothetical protein
LLRFTFAQVTGLDHPAAFIPDRSHFDFLLRAKHDPCYNGIVIIYRSIAAAGSRAARRQRLSHRSVFLPLPLGREGGSKLIVVIVVHEFDAEAS